MQQPQPKVPKHTSHQQVDFKCEEDQELVNNKDDEEAIRLALKEEQKKKKMQENVADNTIHCPQCNAGVVISTLEDRKVNTVSTALHVPIPTMSLFQF